MKRRVYLSLFIALCLMPALPAPSRAGEEKAGANSFEGLWVGTARVLGSAQDRGTCSPYEMPLIFFVRGTTAKSAFPEGRLSFQSEVKPNGKIHFLYRDTGSTRDGAGWSETNHTKFRGKLQGSSGKGSLTVSFCRGRWSVEKTEPAAIRGAQFLVYENSVLILFNDEIVGASKAKEGKEYTGVNASGDFFVVHVTDEAYGQFTLFYRYEDPEHIRRIASLPGHHDFSARPDLRSERGLGLSMEDGRVCLRDGERILDSVGPGEGKTIRDYSACGDFLAVHEGDGEAEIRTIIYYINDSNILSLVGSVEGRHPVF